MHNALLLADLAQCKSPDTLVAAILKHNPEWQAPVDVEAFARSVGISAFCDMDIDGFTSGHRAEGDGGKSVILSAPRLPSQRRRLAIAHQLGHWLMPSHQGARQCTARDLSENRRDTPRRKEEMQANRFAAALLMPKPWFVAFLDSLGKPMVAHLPKIAATYGVPLEVAAERYVELACGLYAILLIKNDVIKFVMQGRSFPPLAIGRGDDAPPSPASASSVDSAKWLPIEGRDWLVQDRNVRMPKMTMQLFSKENGLQIVMLSVNAAAERRADEEAEKSATESPKFGRRSSR